ncbi:hypothetical protein [Pseudoalteromonas sp. PS5]|nr:hypothetical protein [Pseudoalteromonas sp. PS5]
MSKLDDNTLTEAKLLNVQSHLVGLFDEAQANTKRLMCINSGLDVAY